MINLPDIIAYYAQFVPKTVLRKSAKQVAKKSTAYNELLDRLISLSDDSVIQGIDTFIVSINEKYVSEQVANSVGMVLFVEYGSIEMTGDVAPKSNIDLSVVVASPLTMANADVYQELVIMQRNLEQLQLILQKMKDDQEAYDAPACLSHLTFPANIYPVPSATFYDRAGWCARFQREAR